MPQKSEDAVIWRVVMSKLLSIGKLESKLSHEGDD